VFPLPASVVARAIAVNKLAPTPAPISVPLQPHPPHPSVAEGCVDLFCDIMIEVFHCYWRLRGRSVASGDGRAKSVRCGLSLRRALLRTPYSCKPTHQNPRSKVLLETVIRFLRLEGLYARFFITALLKISSLAAASVRDSHNSR
jgi:hypothetical protein